MPIEEKKSRYAKWQAIINEQEASGLSQTQFCKERNISSAQFVYYRSEFKPKQIAAASFSPVTIKQVSPIKEIRLTLPNGFQCIFPSDLSTLQIKELVMVLLSC